ncbi:MAG: hypothetical protein JW888_11975 [Pirellulales bacterium]|nr:hypothetical protein [Pirellulales bacterium]
MRIFLAGIMQGSLVHAAVHDQDYRRHLKELLAEHLPDAELYDPLADHANSIEYDDATGRDVFFRHNRMCRDVDILLAFVPEASMGTAIEMWEAWQHGAVVITISPLKVNWAVRFLSHVVYRDLVAFEADLCTGQLAQQIAELRGHLNQADP